VKTFKSKFSKLTLNTEEILKDLDQGEFENRREAARYAAKVMRKNIGEKGVSRPGGFPTRRTGALRRSIAFQLIKRDRSAKVGSKLFTAHLLEFGHGDGKERNKRPFIFPSLRQAEPEIIKLLSAPYW